MTRDNIIIILDHNHGYSLIYIYPRENTTSKHLKTGNWNLKQCQDSSYKPSFIQLHRCCYSSSSVFKQNRDNIGSFIFLFSPNLRRLNLSQTCQWQWVEVMTKKSKTIIIVLIQFCRDWLHLVTLPPQQIVFSRSSTHRSILVESNSLKLEFKLFLCNPRFLLDS